jgi:hypothetical protein
VLLGFEALGLAGVVAAEDDDAALWSAGLVLGAAAVLEAAEALLLSLCGMLLEEAAPLLSHLSAIILASPLTLKVELSEPVVPLS